MNFYDQRRQQQQQRITRLAHQLGLIALRQAFLLDECPSELQARGQRIVRLHANEQRRKQLQILLVSAEQCWPFSMN